MSSFSLADLTPRLQALAAIPASILKRTSLRSSRKSDTIICFFGSQSGTAEGFAKETASELTKNGFHAKAVDLAKFNKSSLRDSTPYALFFMATTGEGEPCDNSVGFVAFLNKEAPGFASKIKYSVFGLGNSQYENYNAMGKLVNRRLGEMGGQMIHPYGEGDDDNDIEEDFEEWKKDLVASLHRVCHTKSRTPQETSYDFKAVYISHPPAPHGGRVAESKMPLDEVDLSSRHYFEGVPVKIVKHQELRQKTLENGGLGSTVHVEFDLEGTGLSYQTADNLTVCPANDATQVRDTARLLSLDLTQWFVLETNDADTKPLFPTPCTIETALTYFTDLNGAPTRSLLEKLAPLTTMHHDRLLFLSSKSGKDEFASDILSRRLSIYELFEMFPSFRITQDNLGAFFQIMPRLKGRDYTIASSSNLQPNRIALTVGVVQESRQGRVLNGVCSSFIKHQDIGSTDSLVFVKESTFKLPNDPKVPIILIGPGTGIAPMRAFIQERKYQKKILKQKTGDTILFFGCRCDDEDYIYKEELKEALKKGVLTKLHVAFSRQQAEKVYVQHVMLKQKAQLWKYIHKQGAHVYVCGATSMGKDVSLALQSIVQEYSGVDAEAAKEYLKEMQEQNRYIQELWSA